MEVSGFAFVVPNSKSSAKQENTCTDDPEMFQLKKRRNKYAPRGLGFGGQQGFFRSTESVFHVPSSA